MMIKGITVTLHKKTLIGADDFGQPTYSTSTEAVNNVLISPVSSDDAITELSLSGKRVVYELCIPKDDTNTWEDTTVEFFGQTFKTVGFATECIDPPLDWNKKIKVERYG
jgi:hypothetical protein